MKHRPIGSVPHRPALRHIRMLAREVILRAEYDGPCAVFVVGELVYAYAENSPAAADMEKHHPLGFVGVFTATATWQDIANDIIEARRIAA